MALPDNDKKQEKKEKPMTKVIVRRLPATIEQKTFLNQVSPIPDYNYIYIVNGDFSLGENAFSRVYINFVHAEDVFSFKERFDNYVFLDGRGHEYPAVVEFAPFQKIPKKRGKSRVDPKCGSIETDPYYLNFIESLNKPPEQDEKPEYSLQLNNEDKNDISTSTPLLEFIKNKRAQRLKIREMRREERERKRKEFDRRKEYGKAYDDDKYDGKYSEKSPSKGYGNKPHHLSAKVASPRHSDKVSEKDKKSDEKGETSEKPDKFESKQERSYEKYGYKPKEKRFEEKVRKEIKPRFPKKEFSDTREYKPRNDEYRSKDYKDFKEKEYKPKYESRYYDSKKDETKVFPKKVKKYSERREERKLEAQKAEQKKIQETQSEAKEMAKSEEILSTSKKVELEQKSQTDEEHKSLDKSTKSEEKLTSKPSSLSTESKRESPTLEKEYNRYLEKEFRKDSNSKRIRNKDRPTIAIYRPGMLSKRKQSDDTSENVKKEPGKEQKEKE